MRKSGTGRALALIVAQLCVTRTVIAATTYVAIDLRPTGSGQSEANSVGNGKQVGVVWGPPSPQDGHAALWSGSSGSYIDLNPTGFISTHAYDSYGNQQVGWGRKPDSVGNIFNHALLWNGSASQYVDLNLAGVDGAAAYGIRGNQQVGEAGNRAVLWNGSASDFVLLPTFHSNSYSVAYDVNGDQQVGMEWDQAILWQGPAHAPTNLTPGLGGVTMTNGTAYATSGTQQVGWGSIHVIREEPHAIMWNRSAFDYVDLNPNGFVESMAYDMFGGTQIGWGRSGEFGHAMLWNDSPANYLDLHQFLDQSLLRSWAESIDEDGDIVGRASGADGLTYAILWKPVPEPSLISPIVCGLLLVRRVRYSSVTR